MHCEYCDEDLFDVAFARRHVLTIKHIRNKRTYDLTAAKFVERRRQVAKHPRDFKALCLLLNMHSKKDVRCLQEKDFFKMKCNYQYQVAEELVKVIMESSMGYHLNRLPTQIREPLVDLIETSRQEKTDDGNVEES